jgi:hypothetical protein
MSRPCSMQPTVRPAGHVRGAQPMCLWRGIFGRWDGRELYRRYATVKYEQSIHLRDPHYARLTFYFALRCK